MAAKFAIMMPPVSVCHQLSWKGRPNASSPKTTPDGLSGSPTLARKRRAGNSCSRTSSTPVFIIIRIAVGAVYQTETRLRLEDPVPALGVELGLVDDHRHAVRERRDDPVGGARHPAGVGGAPEDVVGVEVERQLAGDVVGDDRGVDVHGALRLAGGAAREVDEGDVLGVGGADLVRVVGGRQQAPVVVRAGHVRLGPALADEDDVLELGQRRPDPGDLPLVEQLGRQRALWRARARGASGSAPGRRPRRAG